MYTSLPTRAILAPGSSDLRRNARPPAYPDLDAGRPGLCAAPLWTTVPVSRLNIQSNLMRLWQRGCPSKQERSDSWVHASRAACRRASGTTMRSAREGGRNDTVRRHCRRRRAQRTGRGGVSGQVRRAHPGTGGPRQDRRRGHTEVPWPEAPQFRVTRLSYVMSLMPPTIINDLDLPRHGYKIFPMGPYYQAFPDGGSIKLYADDAMRNHEEVARWSVKDAEAMPRWDAWLAGLAEVLGPLLLTVPPRIGSRSPRDLAETLRLAWRHRGLDVRTIADVTRLMTMSIADLLDDWFESPQVKGALAVNGVIGTWAGPYAPGTAYVMAHHSIG